MSKSFEYNIVPIAEVPEGAQVPREGSLQAIIKLLEPGKAVHLKGVANLRSRVANLYSAAKRLNIRVTVKRHKERPDELWVMLKDDGSSADQLNTPSN